MRVRFAPSPTGSLHLGNARTALFNWLHARRLGGTLVLRIEDTDTAREQEGSEAGIYRDLAWLGIDWDEGPFADGTTRGDVGPYRQSDRTAHYEQALEQLRDHGAVYADFSTEEALKAAREASRNRSPRELRAERELALDEQARRIQAGEPHVWRFRIPDDVDGQDAVAFADRLRGEVRWPLGELADPVIVRADGRPTYNFAVVVDDAAMKIDLVLRGDDHLSNTPGQVLIGRALGHPQPEFAHLPMVRGTDGAKLSKRHGDVSLVAFRDAGYPPEALFNGLALLGWAPDGERTILTREEILEAFDLDGTSRSPSTFDREKLDWIANQHMQRFGVERLAPAVSGVLTSAGLLDEAAVDALGHEWVFAASELARSALSRFDDAAERLGGLFAQGGEPVDEASADVLRSEEGRAVAIALAERLETEPVRDLEGWGVAKKAVQAASGQKGKRLFQPLRACLLGRIQGPDFDATVDLILKGAEAAPERIASLSIRAEASREWATRSANA